MVSKDKEINERIIFFQGMKYKDTTSLKKNPVVPNFWRPEEYCGKVPFNGWLILILLISHLRFTAVGDSTNGLSDLVELSLCSFCLYDLLIYIDSDLTYSYCDYAWLQGSNRSHCRPIFMSLAVDSNFRIF